MLCTLLAIGHFSDKVHNDFSKYQKHLNQFPFLHSSQCANIRIQMCVYTKYETECILSKYQCDTYVDVK